MNEISVQVFSNFLDILLYDPPFAINFRRIYEQLS